MSKLTEDEVLEKIKRCDNTLRKYGYSIEEPLSVGTNNYVWGYWIPILNHHGLVRMNKSLAEYILSELGSFIKLPNNQRKLYNPFHNIYLNNYTYGSIS